MEDGGDRQRQRPAGQVQRVAGGRYCPQSTLDRFVQILAIAV
jgi:hypothetical protein